MGGLPKKGGHSKKKKGVMFLREVDTLMHTRLAKKCHSIFVNSMRPRGAIDDQLFLTWPRNAIAFSFANFACSLAVPEMVTLSWLA